jgi:malate dehydrogenase (oxaloacetate-decarboxylating)
VELNGVRYEIGQCNNALVFPGVGLGASVVNARWLPDEAFAAAARAVHEFVGPASAPGAPIFPSLSRLRQVSRQVAIAVGQALVDADAAPFLATSDIAARVEDAMWEPVYLKYRPG